MKERPIPFSAPMVRAILAGTKTQTRRAVKWRGLEPGLNLQFSGLSVERSGINFVLTSPTRDSYAYRSVPQPCPYGRPGDRLWVRETHAPAADCWGAWLRSMGSGLRVDGCTIHFAADGGDPFIEKWRQSIHMPRWASRITLEITDVRVERLQDISEADALAEGIVELNGRFTFNSGLHESRTAAESYRALWESINGHGSWDANPWVWVVSFKRAASSEAARTPSSASVGGHNAQPDDKNKCRRCGGAMEPSKVLAPTYTGMPDFAGHDIVTLSPGPGELVDCMKCRDCGHSYTKVDA